MDLPPHNEDGTGGMHVYMPWWLDNKKLDFPRGYHIELGGGRGMPGFGFMGGIHQVQRRGGYGKALKDDYRRFYGSFVGFSGRGEMIPNEDSYCEIDPDVVDRWGIPVLRFHWKWSDYELDQARHMQETFAGIIEAMGGKVVGNACARTGRRTTASRSAARSSTRPATTRMGTSPRTSVLNDWCQAHDVKNLFVADERPVREQRPQELHLDHPRALHAHERAHRRGAEEGEPVSDVPKAATRWRLRIERRELLKRWARSRSPPASP